MPAEVSNPARGTVLQLGIPYATPTYTAVAQVNSLDGPSREVGTRETTHLTSSAKTFAPTIPDNGEVSGELQYDPKGTSHDMLDDLMETPVLVKWKMIFADATNGPTTYAFDGILTALSPTGMEVEETLTADFSIKVSGAITRT